MFDFVFNGIAAFQQISMMLGGLMCLGLGVLIFGNALYWRLYAERIEGTIIGVKQQGIFFFPVYRYTVPSTGEEIEATGDTGSSSNAGMDTGKTLPLLVFAKEPHKARAKAGILFYVLGLFFMGPGILFLYLALTTYPVNFFTLAALAGFSAYGALKIHGKYRGRKLTMAEFRMKRQDKLGNIPLQQIETLNATPERQAQMAQQRKNARYATPMLLIFGLALLGFGGYLGTKMQHLLAVGLHAPGQVTGIESSHSSNSTSYYARVTYRDASGAEHNFRDSAGSSHAFYSTGDNVNVVYLPEDPVKSAEIERGWKNWIPSFALMGFGVLLLGLGFSNLKRQDKAL